MISDPDAIMIVSRSITVALNLDVFSGSEERRPRPCSPEGKAYVDDTDGCDGDFFRCEGGHWKKYTCNFPGLFDENTNKCVDRKSISACDNDD